MIGLRRVWIPIGWSNSSGTRMTKFVVPDVAAVIAVAVQTRVARNGVAHSPFPTAGTRRTGRSWGHGELKGVSSTVSHFSSTVGWPSILNVVREVGSAQLPRLHAISAVLEVAMSHGASFNMPEDHQRPQRVSKVWQLRKGKRFATCELWTHPIGGEIRADVSGNFLQSEAGRQGFALIDKANEWRHAYGRHSLFEPNYSTEYSMAKRSNLRLPADFRAVVGALLKTPPPPPAPMPVRPKAKAARKRKRVRKARGTATKR